MNLKGTKTEANLQTALPANPRPATNTPIAAPPKFGRTAGRSPLFEETAANEKEYAKLWSGFPVRRPDPLDRGKPARRRPG